MISANSRLLLKSGFVKPEKKAKFEAAFAKSRKKTKEEFVDSLKDEEIASFVDEELAELERLGTATPTGYPKPINSFRLFYETPQLPIEQLYFWILHHLRQDQGFTNVIKIADVFAASELSALSGTIQYRLAAQQEKAYLYLKSISEMLKALFQVVREIRILKERLSYYEKAKLPGDAGRAADIALKGIWVDLVEGGAKNPASVYGLAREVGFVILPDLFFRTKIDDIAKIHDAVERWDVNPKVKEVLERKLFQFYTWKEQTWRELASREKFMLKYLRQHYSSMRLYASWVKPYLRTIKRLTMRERLVTAPELVTAFETAAIELEIVAAKQPIGDYHPVIIAHFDYRTTPALAYAAEAYQRGPLHMGALVVTLRSYAWTKAQLSAYQSYREAEEWDMLKQVDESIAQAMDALGEDYKSYLREAGEVLEEEKKALEEKRPRRPSIFEPIVLVGKGFAELFGPLMPRIERRPKAAKTPFVLEREREAAKKAVDYSLWQLYKNFKKSHGLLAW